MAALLEEHMRGLINGRALVATAAFGCVAGVASAASWTDYNAIIRNDLSSIGDVEGAALVGGNTSGNNIFASLGTAPDGLALGVAGNVHGNLNLNNGNARIGGGVVNGNLNNNGGGTVSLGDATISSFVNDMWSQASTAAGLFAGLTANSTTSIEAGNKLRFNAASGADFAVFSISASDLSSYQAFELRANGASTIAINVSGGVGSAINILATMNEFISMSSKIIWNFVDADSTINVQRQVEGSVLAMNAHLNLSAVIEGTVVANSAAMNGQEFHLPGYDGGIPETTTLVPTPTAAMLGCAGFAGLAMRRRRAA